MTPRNTIQKQVISRIVFSACDHPTAEMVFNRAKCELPSISLGTVYRVLNQLVDDNKVQELHFQNAPSRYDKTLCAHAHLLCSNCGGVVDVNFDANKMLAILQNDDTIISDIKINLVGLCEECKK